MTREEFILLVAVMFVAVAHAAMLVPDYTLNVVWSVFAAALVAILQQPFDGV
jgi:hypothetical protein